MKAKWIVLMSAWVGATVAMAVQVGDSYEQVIDELGTPSGLVDAGTFTWLQFDRGTVKLSDGRVVQASLISQQELEMRRLRERDERARRIAAGQAVKDAYFANPTVYTWTAAQQLAFWHDFRMRYPEIPADVEYMGALNQYRVEQAALRRERAEQQNMWEQEQRLRELEIRLQQTEARYRTPPARSYVTVPQVQYITAAPYVYGVPPTVCAIQPRNHIGVSWTHHQRRSPTVTASNLDRVFGPMPVVRGSVYQSRQHSGLSANVRLGF